MPRYCASPIVHHTAGPSTYAPEDSAAIVRGIELYHVKANGWNDIGYNFLVDRYGQVFEGRGGGMHAQRHRCARRGVQHRFRRHRRHRHVFGKPPTRAAEDALGKLLAWRLDVGHVDPASSAMITSGGNAKLRAGSGAYLRAISGHRDAGFTACPGNALYARLGQLREVALTTGLPKLYEPRLSRQARQVAPLRRRGCRRRFAWTVTVTGPGGEDGGTRRPGPGTASRGSGTPRVSDPDATRGRWKPTACARHEAPSRGRSSRGCLSRPLCGPPATGLMLQPRVVSPDGDGYADAAHRAVHIG